MKTRKSIRSGRSVRHEPYATLGDSGSASAGIRYVPAARAARQAFATAVETRSPRDSSRGAGEPRRLLADVAEATLARGRWARATQTPSDWRIDGPRDLRPSRPTGSAARRVL